MKARFPIFLLSGVSLLSGLLPAQSEDGSRWRMTVVSGKLEPIMIRNPVDPGNTRLYWYLRLKITNDTGKSRVLVLSALGLTPQLKRTPQTRPGLYPGVMKKIREKEGNKKLLNLFEASGRISEGESREIVIVFGRLSRFANKVDVRVKGLANALYRQGAKVWAEDTQLSVKFHRIGDQFEITRQDVRRKGMDWITVSRRKIRG